MPRERISHMRRSTWSIIETLPRLGSPDVFDVTLERGNDIVHATVRVYWSRRAAHEPMQPAVHVETIRIRSGLSDCAWEAQQWIYANEDDVAEATDNAYARNEAAHA